LDVNGAGPIKDKAKKEKTKTRQTTFLANLAVIWWLIALVCFVFAGGPRTFGTIPNQDKCPCTTEPYNASTCQCGRKTNHIFVLTPPMCAVCEIMVEDK
jgi:hypothetical protein